MDENVFREVARGYDPQRCRFAKAILMRCAECSRAQRVLIAERESLHCLSPAGYERCGKLLELMRENALFALGVTQPEPRLPHGKEVKLECGGLGALSQLLGQSAVDDVDALVQEAQRRHHTLEALPWSEIVRGIGGYSLRRRSDPGRKA